MTVIRPDGIDALGNQALWIVPAIAGLTLATPKITIAEINAGKNVVLQVYGFDPQAEQASAPDVRLGDTSAYESAGRVTRTGPTVNYVYDPQMPADATNYFMPGICTQGMTKYVVDRRGLARDAAVAASQYVDIYTITFGVATPVPVDATADGQKLRRQQKWFLSGRAYPDVAVSAT